MQHPVFPVQKEILQKWNALENGDSHWRLFTWGVDVLQCFWDSLLHLVRCMKYICVRVPQVIWLRWKKRHDIQAIAEMSFDVVMKSWCFGEKRLESDSDFYFGDLQHRLKHQNLNTLLLCGDPTYSDVGAFVNAQIETKGLQRFPELLLVPFWAFFLMFFWQMITSLKLYYFSLREPHCVMRYITRLAARDVLMVETLTKGLYYWIGQKTAQRWHPKSFITLYEGRSWEACVLRGIKKKKPDCKVVGYQHAVLFSSSITLLQPDFAVLPDHVPDIILCLGPQTCDMMNNGHLAERIVFGSFRRPKNIDTTSFDWFPTPKKKTVLVLPEGYPEETIALFNFAMNLAKELSDYQFILRCHPAFSFSLIEDKLEYDLNGFANVVLSTDGFDEDIKRSSVVFYRGTSSVIYTILQGIRPFYLDLPHSHNVDPLFALDYWRACVSSVSDAVCLLHEYEQLPDHIIEEDWAIAVEYVDRYVVPVEDDAVRRLFKLIA